MIEIERRINNIDGSIFFYIKDTLIYHRDDGPAYEHRGDKYFYQYGKLHRLDGGPAIELANNNKYWFQYGKCHRLDGPAQIFNGIEEWFINNKKLPCKSQEEFEKLLKMKIFW